MHTASFMSAFLREMPGRAHQRVGWPSWKFSLSLSAAMQTVHLLCHLLSCEVALAVAADSAWLLQWHSCRMQQALQVRIWYYRPLFRPACCSFHVSVENASGKPITAKLYLRRCIRVRVCMSMSVYCLSSRFILEAVAVRVSKYSGN